MNIFTISAESHQQYKKNELVFFCFFRFLRYKQNSRFGEWHLCGRQESFSTDWKFGQPDGRVGRGVIRAVPQGKKTSNYIDPPLTILKGRYNTSIYLITKLLNYYPIAVTELNLL